MAREDMSIIRRQVRALNKRPSNADKLRAMTDEELADVLTDIGVRTLRLHRLPVAEPVIEQAKEDWLDWLRQEVSDGD